MTVRRSARSRRCSVQTSATTAMRTANSTVSPMPAASRTCRGRRTGSTAANSRKPSMMAMRVSRKLALIRSNGSATYRIASTATATMARGASAIQRGRDAESHSAEDQHGADQVEREEIVDERAGQLEELFVRRHPVRLAGRVAQRRQQRTEPSVRPAPAAATPIAPARRARATWRTPPRFRSA